jgi:uroporphyrinogen-III synthase
MATAPLAGFVIGVTADRRADEQCEMLRRRGARVLHGPTIRTVPLAPDVSIHAATDTLVASPPDVVVANTGIGIRSWFAAAESWGRGDDLIDALSGARILARGPKAAGAILTTGLPVEWRAPSETLAEAVDEVLRSTPTGSHVAVQLDGNAEQRDVERLREAGYRVTDVRVYEWNEPTDTEPAARLLQAVCDRRVDAITFTSAAALQSFVALAAAQGCEDELRDAVNGPVLAVCVGPVCARVADSLGLRGFHPERPRLGAMVHWLTAELAQRRRQVRLAGIDVSIQGSAVTLGDDTVTLTEREQAVLDILVAREGRVASRSQLLRAVWGAASDEHALEVTIARLRRKLGPAGAAVRTVVRRGYRLQID